MENPSATATAQVTELAPAEAAPVVADAATTPVVESDMLIEEISIDGMCGVY